MECFAFKAFPADSGTSLFQQAVDGQEILYGHKRNAMSSPADSIQITTSLYNECLRMWDKHEINRRVAKMGDAGNPPGWGAIALKTPLLFFHFFLENRGRPAGWSTDIRSTTVVMTYR